jgi:hypothetical protein
MDWQMVQGIGQVGAMIVAFYAVRLVQNYTHKKDEADFIRNRWNEQAQLNLICIQNDEALTAHEEIVYGQPMYDIKQSRRFFVIFSMLNQIQHLYIAFRHGILEKDEFESYALQTAKLLKREEATVKYLLAQRGYASDFKDAVVPLLARAIAPEFPAAPPAQSAHLPVSKTA